MVKSIIVGLSLSLSLAACSSGTAPAETPTTGNSAEPAPAATAPRDDAGVRAAVTALFAPYAQASHVPLAEALTYTTATRALIDEWRRTQPEDEVTFLGDFDWLCQCQDWESTQFRVTQQDIEWTGDDAATVTVNYTQMTDRSAQLRLMMARQGGAWKIADMEFAEGDKLFTTHLREEIAEARRTTGATQ
jgi:hypothetical protein